MVLALAHPVRAGPVEQDRHGHAAGGAVGDFLVAARQPLLAARRAAARSVLSTGRDRRPRNGVFRTYADRRQGQRVRSLADRAVALGRARALVLLGKTVLARRSDVL